ncbi:LysR family transcriptional regulator [Paraburkholderia sp. BCC1886]|uniref:LysR family transcriptional regulator n=1 Tax=Paraburkholderia sp. BCC1886 TaxID=2562670 RepID=UPI001642C8FD|nr:LysR family transcriptional regulator [Paraburkholderia sp. BCC1886]
MDRVDAMRAFVQVVDCLSFTQAADHLHLATGTVSRFIHGLEKQTNVRLLNRTTRNVSPTEEGRAYYDACVRVLEQIDSMNEDAANAGRTPEGRIKVGLSAAIAKGVLIPALPELLEKFPKLNVEMTISDGQFNLAKEAVDCTLRIGEIRENSVIAREVGRTAPIMCASPSYLARYGEPRTLAELGRHVAVAGARNDGTGLKAWEVGIAGNVAPVTMQSRVMVNDTDSFISCALSGLGIISGYRFALQPYLEDGSLREILQSIPAATTPVSIVYYPNRYMPNKLRVFIDWFKDVFRRAIVDTEQSRFILPARREPASSANTPGPARPASRMSGC